MKLFHFTTIDPHPPAHDPQGGTRAALLEVDRFPARGIVRATTHQLSGFPPLSANESVAQRCWTQNWPRRRSLRERLDRIWLVEEPVLHLALRRMLVTVEDEGLRRELDGRHRLGIYGETVGLVRGSEERDDVTFRHDAKEVGLYCVVAFGCVNERFHFEPPLGPA